MDNDDSRLRFPLPPLENPKTTPPEQKKHQLIHTPFLHALNRPHIDTVRNHGPGRMEAGTGNDADARVCGALLQIHKGTTY